MAPLILRVVLGITFIWAGLGKIVGELEVSGQDAAVLANMGVSYTGGATAPPSTQPTVPFEEEGEGEAPPPAETPTETPTEETPVEPAPGEPGDAAEAPDDAPPPDDEGDGGGLALRAGAQVSTVAFQGAQAHTAAEFPDPVRVRAVHGVTLMLYKASHPGYDSGGRKLKAYWPVSLGEGNMAIAMAWLVALGEVACGASMILGLLTRIGALGIAVIMLGAMWLSQIGPAVQSGSAVLGFLPTYAKWSPAWSDLLFQFALFGAALAVMLLGAGVLSVDRLLFGPACKPKPVRADEHDTLEDEPE